MVSSSPITCAFSGADTAAAEAYIATVADVVQLRTSTGALQGCLDHCPDFAVGHAYAAFIASLAGDTSRATGLAALARGARPGITRRERQLVEILLLSVDGDRRRAAALAAEHVGEFADDAAALTIVERWLDGPHRS